VQLKELLLFVYRTSKLLIMP